MRYASVRHAGDALPSRQDEAPLVPAEEPPVVPIRRTRSGVVDTEYYMRQARQLRADFMRQMLHRLCVGVGDFLRGVASARRAAWRGGRWFRNYDKMT